MTQSVTPVACGIWIKDQKVFMQKRPEGKICAGAWEFPGGKVEAGESSEAALCREMAEELGLTVTILQKLGRVTHTYPHGTVAIDFFLMEAEGRPQAKESQTFAFFSKDEIPTESLPTVFEALELARF